MRFNATKIEGCFEINLHAIEDDRGGFARVFCQKEALPYIGQVNFVQINHSINHKKGTFRGMHFQNTPFAEGKLIRCIAGSVMDFVLDIRKNSPTFLKWISFELSAKNQKMVYIPKGVAHGFQTLEDTTELLYHHTQYYNKRAEGGICFNDPSVNIILPLPIGSISEKDKTYHLIEKSFKGIEV
jgi:dTDP-4-dehydrorhamnose 3,5-epimerase